MVFNSVYVEKAVGGGRFAQRTFAWPLCPLSYGPPFHTVSDHPMELTAARYHGKQLSQWLQQGTRQ